jgi:hypothetical protein
LNKKKINRVLEVVIGTAFVVVLIYVISVTVKVTKGVSKTIETPGHAIRLQVLNGCGVRGLATKTADGLSGYRDSDIEIMVVDTDNFSVREVPRSFLISRDEDKTAAAILAQKLGLDVSEIVYRTLENNYRHVSVTLVLGKDHEDLRLTLESEKEKKR